VPGAAALAKPTSCQPMGKFQNAKSVREKVAEQRIGGSTSIHRRGDFFRRQSSPGGNRGERRGAPGLQRVEHTGGLGKKWFPSEKAGKRSHRARCAALKKGKGSLMFSVKFCRAKGLKKNEKKNLRSENRPGRLAK